MVEFLTAEETGASFPKTNIRVKPNQTAVTEDKKVLTTLLDEQKDIREVYNELSYDELAEALHDWLNPNEEGGEKGSEKIKTPASSKVLESAVTSTTEVSDAFDDLFNS